MSEFEISFHYSKDLLVFRPSRKSFCNETFHLAKKPMWVYICEWVWGEIRQGEKIFCHIPTLPLGLMKTYQRYSFHLRKICGVRIENIFRNRTALKIVFTLVISQINKGTSKIFKD